jgi:hypothetical protein
MISNNAQVVDGAATVPTVLEHAVALDTMVQSAPADVVRVGVIGYGYWGPNIVRNFHALENAQIATVCV